MGMDTASQKPAFLLHEGCPAMLQDLSSSLLVSSRKPSLPLAPSGSSESQLCSASPLEFCLLQKTFLDDANPLTFLRILSTHLAVLFIAGVGAAIWPP